MNGLRNSLLVNDHGHSFLAMLGLRAVKPHRGSVIDHDGVCGNFSRCGCNWHKARIDAGDIGVEGNRLAWLVEGRLGDCVVCGRVLELNHISNSGDYFVR